MSLCLSLGGGSSEEPSFVRMASGESRWGLWHEPRALGVGGTRPGPQWQLPHPTGSGLVRDHPVPSLCHMVPQCPGHSLLCPCPCQAVLLPLCNAHWRAPCFVWGSTWDGPCFGPRDCGWALVGISFRFPVRPLLSLCHPHPLPVFGGKSPTLKCQGLGAPLMTHLKNMQPNHLKKSNSRSPVKLQVFKL